MYPRIAPFAIYMAFIALEEGLVLLNANGFLHIKNESLLFLYPIRVLITGLVLIACLPRYRELRPLDFLIPKQTSISILIGIAVFVLWINMDWPFAVFGSPQGYNPSTMESILLRDTLIISRLIGAVAVVPVMEEIFWRSFFIRYSINKDFGRIPIGQFTSSSFLLITVLFGLEHNLFLAGMMAGAAYNILLYYTRNISQCILAHAVTNLALGIYVLQTEKWHFW